MTYPTGIPLLDDIFGGGIPVGLTIIHGEESCGKTCLALSVLSGSLGGYIDLESRADPAFIQRVGPDILHAYPTSGEAAIEAAYTMLNKGVKVVCLDSLEMMVPLSEMSRQVGDWEPYAQKRLVVHGLTILRKLAKEKGAAVLAISQVRINPKDRKRKPRSSFALLLKNGCDAILRMSRVQSVSAYGVMSYAKILAQVERLLVAPPLREQEIYLWNDRGFDVAFELLRKLEFENILIRKGSYWKYSGSHSLGPGKDNATETIRKNLNEFRRLLDDS